MFKKFMNVMVMMPPEELRGFNDVLSHRPTANPDTPKASTRARVDIKPTFLQKELAKIRSYRPEIRQKTLGPSLLYQLKGFTDPARGL